MNKKIINAIMVLISLILVVYFIYDFINPLFYSQVSYQTKDVTDEEIQIAEKCFSKYMQACIEGEEKSIKAMLPLIKKGNIAQYESLTNFYSENDITEVNQNVIYNISKIANNIYQIKFYSKTGNIVSGLLDNTIIIKVNKMSKSFNILFDSNLVVRGE